MPSGSAAPEGSSTKRPGLDRLAAVAQEVSADWGIELGERFASHHSFIAAADGDAVLKIVGHEELDPEQEASALDLWNGDHAVRLLRQDPARKALLLERARPGTDLSRVPEEEAIPIAVEVGRHLWHELPDGSGFGDVVELSDRWLEQVAELDPDLVRQARGVLEGIRLRTRRSIHGDFHHHNILRRGDGWAAIDPQPAVGEPEYDVATLLWNPIGTTPTPERTSRWISAFADAGLDPGRMRAWAAVRGTILSFSSRPGRRHEPQLQVARSLL